MAHTANTDRGTLMHRRSVVFGALAGAVSGFASAASPPPPSIVVWKDRNCGCCKDWITHLQKNGFQVQAHDTGNKAVRQSLGMPEEFGSCHTAQVGGYVIEGHVPASDILQLLREKPVAIGLAVPGMPIGSPGMDSPLYGNRKDPYQVLLVRRSLPPLVFKSYS